MQAPSLLSGPSIRSACRDNVGLTRIVYVKQGKHRVPLEMIACPAGRSGGDRDGYGFDGASW
jgi:hypothetical protein